MHIVTAQDDADFTTEYTVKVYPAEYLAAVEVRGLLKEVLGHREVYVSTSSDFSANRFLTDNLVCIGGPVHNRVTQILLERLELPFFFDGFVLRSRFTDACYEAEIDPVTSRITRDIGVACLASNPFNPEAQIAILMGARTLGCAAAAQFLTSGSLRHADEALGRSLPKWAILDVDVVDDFVARTELIASSGL